MRMQESTKHCDAILRQELKGRNKIRIEEVEREEGMEGGRKKGKERGTKGVSE